MYLNVNSERDHLRWRGNVFDNRRRQGQTLSNSWQSDRRSETREKNLFARRSCVVFQRLGTLRSQSVRVRHQGSE